MKLFSRFILVATSLTLSFTAVTQQAAEAGTLKYTFNVNTDTFGGSGIFSFDDSNFSDEAIPTASIQLLNFTFNNDPQTVYTEQDDFDYPSLGSIVFPTVAGNSPLGLSYLFNNKIDSAISYEIAGYNFIVGNQTFSDTISYTAIPEPATLVGTLTACSIGWLTSRKVKSAKKSA